MKLIGIAAINRFGLLGSSQKGIPWKCVGDIKHFKETTTGSVVIMGRTTYESIGRPLPNRVNIVLSRKASVRASDASLPENLVWVPDKEKALQKALEASSNGNVYVMGGLQIYTLFMKDMDEFLLSIVDAPCAQGDIYFNLDKYLKYSGDWALKNISFRRGFILKEWKKV